MWLRLWIAFGVSTAVFSQHSSSRVHHAGAGFEWGWQLSPAAGAGNGGAVGQYYVKLPESEQRVVYAADGSGYHGASALNTSTHSSLFALGQRAIDLHAQHAQHPHQKPQPPQQNGNVPVDIYLLQQQLQTPIPQPQPFRILTAETNVPHYYNRLTPLYNIQTQHSSRNDESERYDSSKPLKKEALTEQTFVTPVVQVFKDHNCSDDKNPEIVSKELDSDLQKSKQLFAEVASYASKDINGNFGAKTRQPITYRGEASFRVETPRPNARNERFYHTTEATPSASYNATQEGINRLVASTQDLITNEDLLRINNAIEEHLRVHNDDLIKPRARFSVRNQNRNNQETLDVSPTTITVKAKISNILRGEIQHMEKNAAKEQVLQSDSNEYRFSSPIVVAEAQDENFNKQIIDNVVSTVVPYLENGYKVVDIKNSPEEHQYYESNTDENLVNVTPRPIGTNYLAPITVALRLLNSNENDTFNYVEDHEAADSELVSDTVETPNKDKTTVEVQESIPVSITHINDVEVHEYIDVGRSNNNNKDAYDFAKNLYDNYVESVRSSKKIQDNMNKILLYKFGSLNSNENSDKDNENANYINDSNDHLEPSENVQSHVEISPNGENNQRSEQIYYNEGEEYASDSQKIIQPIIIEKQVPITKYVDRYIEKQVPHTETVTVPVPVDRPVPYAVHVEKVVEKPVHVTKYVDKPYPVEVPRPYPVEVKVPYPVQQKVYVDRPIRVPYPVEKIVEKEVVHSVPVPTPVAVPVEMPYPVEQKVLYPFPVDRPVPVAVEVEKPVERIVHKEIPVPYLVEKRVPYPVPYETKVPVPYPVEKRVPVPVERIVEKPVTVTQVIEKPVHIEVPVPHPVPVHVHHPYPVDRIVERKVPYPVHVDRIVEKKVNVPYPVEKIVEKIVEKPVVVTKYVNKPYPVEVKVPYPVERKVPYAVHVPVEVKIPYQVEKPRNYEVAYRYGYRPSEAAETRNNLQYQLLDQEQLKRKQYQHLKAQYEQYVKDYQKQNKTPQPQSIPTQSTYWGNQYASSYQYINDSADIRQPDWKKNQAYTNYINYLTNSQHQNVYHDQDQGQNLRQSQYNNQNQYNGQSNDQSQEDANQGQYQNQRDHAHAQSQNQNNWNKNKDYLLEYKVRRTDRVPKVTIEYGGFKPPLIPSTEVDLDGMPVNKSE